ncbi:hypothetical protein [Neisseria sp. 83E34]
MTGNTIRNAPQCKISKYCGSISS